MRITRQTPTVVHNGRERTVTTRLIAELLAEGLTVSDYQVLALTADFYGFSVPELMRLALECEGVQ